MSECLSSFGTGTHGDGESECPDVLGARDVGAHCSCTDRLVKVAPSIIVNKSDLLECGRDSISYVDSGSLARRRSTGTTAESEGSGEFSE